jgi:hypothetical protein
MFLNIGDISENLDFKWSGTLISTSNAPNFSSMTERNRYLLNRGHQLKVMRECEWKKAIKENQDLKQNKHPSNWNMVLVSLQKPSTGYLQIFFSLLFP